MDEMKSAPMNASEDKAPPPFLSRVAVALVGLHILLGCVYSVIVPAWEAHDEWAHYEYVAYVAKHRTLPPGDPPLTTLFGYDESTQPPLYYVLAAIPVAFVNPSDGLTPVVNPYATSGSGVGGVNMVVHDFEAESFPFRGTLLAMHIARLVSVLLSAVGVWYVFLLARWLVPYRPDIVLLSTAFAAFWPQYLFIGSVITNDVLIASLGCAFLYFVVRLAVAEHPHLHDLLGVSLSLGLAFLTKYTALGLLPVLIVASLVAIARKVRKRQIKQVAAGAATLFGLVALLSGWWFARNLFLHGYLVSRDAEIVAELMKALSPSNSSRQLSLAGAPKAMWYGFQTFWASFGWGNVGLPEWAYYPVAVLAGLALVGSLALISDRRSPSRLRASLLILAFGFISLSILLFGREVLKGEAVLRGRLLLPMLPAACIGMAAGLLWWLPPRVRNHMGLAMGSAIFVVSALMPFLVIRPAYLPPPLLTSSELPPGAQPTAFRFGDFAELYGFHIWPETVRQGRAVGVTLYWRALSQYDGNLSIGVYALGAEAQPYGQVVHYPGNGNFATSLWRPGDLLKETFWVPITADRPVPCRGQIAVTLFLDEEEPLLLPVSDPAGNALGYAAIFGRFKIAPNEPPTAELRPPIALFGDQISLVECDISETWQAGGYILVRATFQALRRPDADYIIFVHILDPDGRQVVGLDGEPLLGNYPTGLWDAGEIVMEERRLRLPERLADGSYRVGVGFYNLDTLRRVPAFDAEGYELSHQMWSSQSFVVQTNEHEHYLPLISIVSP